MTAAIAKERAASRVRFRIIAAIFLLTTINYASRATLSIAGAPLADQARGLSIMQAGFASAGPALCGWGVPLCGCQRYL